MYIYRVHHQLYSRYNYAYNCSRPNTAAFVLAKTRIVCEIFPAQTDKEYRNGALSTIEASNMKRSVTLYSGNMKEMEQDIDSGKQYIHNDV